MYSLCPLFFFYNLDPWRTAWLDIKSFTLFLENFALFWTCFVYYSWHISSAILIFLPLYVILSFCQEALRIFSLSLKSNNFKKICLTFYCLWPVSPGTSESFKYVDLNFFYFLKFFLYLKYYFYSIVLYFFTGFNCAYVGSSLPLFHFIHFISDPSYFILFVVCFQFFSVPYYIFIWIYSLLDTF